VNPAISTANKVQSWPSVGGAPFLIIATEWRDADEEVPQYPQPTQLQRPAQAVLVAVAATDLGRSGPLSVKNRSKDSGSSSAGNPDNCSHSASDRNRTGIPSTLRQPLRRCCSSDGRVGF
jgi:hypothetical protein